MTSREKYGLVRVVKKLEIFRERTEEEALHILGLCERKAFQTEEVIWNPGDPGVDMLVLITGKLHVKSDAGEIVGQSCPAHPSGRWPASRDTTASSASRRWSLQPHCLCGASLCAV